ncbi:hypothetical protein IVB27_32340 [Bradyrhizobium sp. 197]|uniref:hypothetical protein n=1 Tax=Bradyrhizobium sp. 197 TaxID=2782663 RepID=UPI001FFA116A|nr:hypothetical protein [Bradyrhizobium sp. 197]MCK1479304.1 hypothetical protein [Bradyrhizobium sp. 197]
MSIAATTPRNAAQFLVERAERQSGSRMVAYEMVAQTVGTSADWLRKFVNGTGAKEPGWTVGWNLIEHCNRVLCTRVEREIDKERSKAATLKREIDAVNSPVGRVVASAQGAQASSTSAVAGPSLGKDP